MRGEQNQRSRVGALLAATVVHNLHCDINRTIPNTDRPEKSIADGCSHIQRSPGTGGGECFPSDANPYQRRDLFVPVMVAFRATGLVIASEALMKRPSKSLGNSTYQLLE